MRIGYRRAGIAGNRLILSITRTSQRDVPTIGGSVRMRPVEQIIPSGCCFFVDQYLKFPDGFSFACQNFGRFRDIDHFH